MRKIVYSSQKMYLLSNTMQRYTFFDNPQNIVTIYLYFHLNYINTLTYGNQLSLKNRIKMKIFPNFVILTRVSK